MDSTTQSLESTKAVLRSTLETKTEYKKSNRGGIRSKKNRLKEHNKQINLSILGTNSAGLKAKYDSLLQVMKIFDFPSCITLQETKFTQKGVKLSGYGVFEKVRKTQNGGGLLTAVNLNLDPVEIESVNEEVEILIVQCQIEKMKLRVINAYGPQEDDPFEKRALFWQTLESDIVQAKKDNCMVYDQNHVYFQNMIDKYIILIWQHILVAVQN